MKSCYLAIHSHVFCLFCLGNSLHLWCLHPVYKLHTRNKIWNLWIIGSWRCWLKMLRHYTCWRNEKCLGIFHNRSHWFLWSLGALIGLAFLYSLIISLLHWLCWAAFTEISTQVQKSVSILLASKLFFSCQCHAIAPGSSSALRLSWLFHPSSFPLIAHISFTSLQCISLFDFSSFVLKNTKAF